MYVLEMELKMVHFACVQRKSSCSRERDRRPSSGPMLGLKTTSIVFSGPSKHPGTYSGVTCVSSGAPVRDTADDDAADSMNDGHMRYTSLSVLIMKRHWSCVKFHATNHCTFREVVWVTVGWYNRGGISTAVQGSTVNYRSISLWRVRKNGWYIRRLVLLFCGKCATNFRCRNLCAVVSCTFCHSVRQIFVNHFFICLVANVRKCQTPGLRLKPPGRLGC